MSTHVPQGVEIYHKDNFESGGLSEWSETTTVGASSIGAIASTNIDGSYIMRAVVGDNVVCQAFALESGLALDAFYGRFTLRFSTNELANNETVQIAVLRKSNNADVVKIRLKEVSGLYNIGATTTGSTWGSTNLSLDTNYRVEFRYEKATNFQLWVEGTLQFTLNTSINQTIDRFVLGLISDSQREATSYFDEVFLVSHRLGPVTRGRFMTDPRLKHILNLKDPKGLNFARRPLHRRQRKNETQVRIHRRKGPK